MINIFIGTSPGTDDKRAEKVLAWTLKKNSSEDLSIRFMRNDYDPLNFFSGFNSSTWWTPFSNLRWAIPHACGFSGRAIYMDVDQVNFRDISELYHMDLQGAPLAIRKGGRTCVTVFDCEKMAERLPSLEEIKHSPDFGKIAPSLFKDVAAKLDPRWNCLDGEDMLLKDIWHLHFTTMHTQPWVPSWAYDTHAKKGVKFVPHEHPRPELANIWKSLDNEITSTKNNKFLNILTTATPRASLHKKGLIKVIKELSVSSFNLRLFVNLDVPDGFFSEEDVQESLNQIKSLEPFVESLHITINKENPSFARAGKTLFLECEKHIKYRDHNLFFWLEDDWTFGDSNNIVKLKWRINDFFFDYSYDYIFSINNYVSGNPTIFRLDLFKETVETHKSCEAPIDPEIVFFMTMKKLYGVEKPVPKDNKMHWLQDSFKDIGRDWRAERNIGKIPKRSQQNNTWIAK